MLAGTSSSRGASSAWAHPDPDEFEEIEVVPVAVDELRQDLRAAAPRYVTDVSSALALGLALSRLDELESGPGAVVTRPSGPR